MSSPDPHSADSATSTELSLRPQYPVKSSRSLVARAAERVTPSRGHFLGLIWILALLATVALLQGIQGDASKFFGIAEGELQTISFQYPVEIVDIPVVEGEQVDQQARLLEVRRYDLDVNLQIIEEQINEIRAKQTATRHNINAEINRLKAEQSASLQSLATEIDSLESKHRQNQALLNSISSQLSTNDPQASPLQVRIGGLKAERGRQRQLFQAKIWQQQQRLADLSAPGDARIAELVKSREELQRQEQALVVHAPFAGSVGSVLFKQGEQVAAFSAVMSIQGRNPQSIKGYIHEAVSNRVQIGQRVWVQSLNAVSDNQLVEGRVESLGSRIVEYPLRLKRSPMVAAWGREAIINLIADNGLLQGEKVSVLLDRPLPVDDRIVQILDDFVPISRVHAWVSESKLLSESGDPTALLTDVPLDIEVAIDLRGSGELEASGLVWDPAREAYLLVSDEHSAVFELARDGRVNAAFTLDADHLASDLESISRDAGFVYLATSLSHSRKGKLPPQRRKLLRLQPAPQGLTNIEFIDLYQVFNQLAIDPQTEPRLRQFLRVALAANEIDLESHRVKDNRLYLGFKSPFNNAGQTVIVVVDTIDTLFAGKGIDASIWQTLDLGGSLTGSRQRLSDFAMEENQLYLLSVDNNNGKPVSYLSGFNTDNRQLTRIAEYPGLKAEGLDIHAGFATIVFDGGGKSPSQWLRRKL